VLDLELFFSRKHWIVITIIILLFGVLVFFLINNTLTDETIKERFDGVMLNSEIIWKNDDLIIPFLLIFYSELIFSLEYREGTLLTEMLLGESKKRWFLKRLIGLYFFILIQYVVMSLLILFLPLLVGKPIVSKYTVNYFKEIGILKAFSYIILTTLVNYSKAMMFLSIGNIFCMKFPNKPLAGPIFGAGVSLVLLQLIAKLDEKMPKLINVVEEYLNASDVNGLIVFNSIALIFFTTSYFIFKKTKVENFGM